MVAEHQQLKTAGISGSRIEPMTHIEVWRPTLHQVVITTNGALETIARHTFIIPKHYRAHLRRHQLSYCIIPPDIASPGFNFGIHLLPSRPPNLAGVSATQVTVWLNDHTPIASEMETGEPIAQADDTDIWRPRFKGGWDLKFKRGEHSKVTKGITDKDGWGIYTSDPVGEAVQFDYSSIFTVELEWLGGRGAKSPEFRDEEENQNISPMFGSGG